MTAIAAFPHDQLERYNHVHTKSGRFGSGGGHNSAGGGGSSDSGGGGGGGEDTLKLGKTADLQPGEKLLGSGKVDARSGTIYAAQVDHGGHKMVHLGVGGEDFGGSHDEDGPWRAGRGRTTKDAAGYTANLDHQSAVKLHDSLTRDLGAAVHSPDRPGKWGDHFSVEGSVSGQWADVHYAVYLDDPAIGVRVTLGAVPHGSGRDLENLDGHQQTATLTPAESKKFLRLLGNYTGRA